MTPDESRVADLIRAAFSGVTLGDGVGLCEAQGLDDYEDDATLAKLRRRDETQDWLRISVEDLNRCYSSLSFFDAEGMRFHIPAFLIADLEGTFNQEVIFTLCYPLRQSELFGLLSMPAPGRPGIPAVAALPG